MTYFGFITEGPTDRIVLENILIGYFDEDISRYFTPLQPKQKDEIGGWTKVLSYCQSTDFLEAFDSIDFMVIQIDTDRSFDLPFDVPHEEQGVKISVEQLVENVKERFKKLFDTAFGTDFFPNYGQRILFAITVHETECWLLPLYYSKEKEAGSIKNCYEILNKKVKGLQKTYKIYDVLSTDFSSPKKLEKASQANPSFKIFIENELKAKIIF
jgi:hypothetical protein